MIFTALVSAYHPAMARTDAEAQENYLKALVNSQQQNTEHSDHIKPIDDNKKFRGVFYGFTPCADCMGIKTTLSLKQNNTYLLVTQPARETSREYYEKGKYTWNDQTNIVTLTPRKSEDIRQYSIENEETLIELNENGKRFTGEEAKRYILRRSDATKTREVHIH